jgi:putative spermidine/putrescine transport system permease protein
MTRTPNSLADRLGVGVIHAAGIFGILLLVAPSLIVVAISFDTRSFVSFPPVGFTFDWYAKLFATPELIQSMWVSLKVGLVVTGLCLVLGVPTAIACVRGRFSGRGALSVFVLFPHMVPGIVLGIAILFAGATINARPSIGLQSVSVACFILAVMIRIVMARLMRLDVALEEASANLGATRWQTFRHVVLPLLLPAIWAGAAFTFIEGFDNISVAIFTHGHRDRPLPVELMSLVQTDNTPMVAAVSAVQIALSVVVLGIVSATLGLEKVND